MLTQAGEGSVAAGNDTGYNTGCARGGLKVWRACAGAYIKARHCPLSVRTAVRRKARPDGQWHARRARREAVLKQAVEGAVADGEYKGMNNYIDYTAVRPASPSAHSLPVLGLEVSSGA